MMERPRTVLFFEKCRLCLDKPGSANICEVQDLPQDIYACTRVKVSPTDNLPQKICIQCYEIVKQAKGLRLLATANDAALRNLLLDDYDNNTEKTSPNTTLNCTDFLEIIENSSNKNTNDQSQKGKEKDPQNIDQNILNSHKNIDKQSHKQKINTNKKCNKEVTNDENCKPTQPTQHFGIKVRKDLFEPLPSQVSSSLKPDTVGKETETAVPKKRISNELGEEIFICEVCKKTLQTRKKLYMHQRQHNKSFICPLDACGKKFAIKNDLERHKRTHTGEKPYNCDICDKSFAQQGTLKAHKEAVHSATSSATN